MYHRGEGWKIQQLQVKQDKVNMSLLQFLSGAAHPPVLRLEWGGLHALVAVDRVVLLLHEFVLFSSGMENGLKAFVTVRYTST